MSDVQDDIVDPVDQTPAAEPVLKVPEAPKAPSTVDKTGLRDAIKASVEKVNAARAEKEQAAKVPDAPDGRVRGPDGKFLPKDQQPAAAQAQAPKETTPKPVEQAKPGAEPPTKADAAPGTWKAEAKAEWDKLPPSVKAEALRRESDFSREIGKYQQQIQQINQSYGPIEQLIGPRRAGWKLDHGSEAKALETLLNYSDLAGSDPNAFLARYLSNPDVASKVDLQRVFGQQAPDAGGDITRHPTFQAAMQKITGLEQQVTGFLNQQQTATRQTTEQQVASFFEAKDESGAPKRPHAEAVREDIFKLAPALQQQYPNASVEELLDKAYNVAIRTNGTVAGEIAKADEERIRSQLEAQARAKRAQLANKSVLPSGPAPGSESGAAVSATDLRATIKRSAAKVWGGADARI